MVKCGHPGKCNNAHKTFLQYGELLSVRCISVSPNFNAVEQVRLD